MQLFYTSFQGSGHDAAYSLLAYAVKKEYAIDLPALEKTPGGKPFFPGRKEIHFSLSHTRGYALCALSRENVGCDMETVTRPVGDALRLRVCTPDQLAAFDFFVQVALIDYTCTVFGYGFYRFPFVFDLIHCFTYSIRRLSPLEKRYNTASFTAMPLIFSSASL